MVNIFESSVTPPNAPVPNERGIEKNIVHQAENNAKEKFNGDSNMKHEKDLPKTPRNSIDTNYAGLGTSVKSNITNENNLNLSKSTSQPRLSITIDRFCVQSVEDAALVMKELNNRPVTINNVIVHDDSACFFKY